MPSLSLAAVGSGQLGSRAWSPEAPSADEVEEYIAAHRLQFLFAEAALAVRSLKLAGDPTPDGELVSRVLRDVYHRMRQDNGMVVGFRSSVDVSFGATSSVRWRRARVGGTECVASVSHRAPSGNLNAEVTLNASQLDASLAFVTRMTPYALSDSVSATDDTGVVTVAVDGTTLRCSNADGCCERAYSGLLSFLREARQQTHLRNAFEPVF